LELLNCGLLLSLKFLSLGDGDQLFLKMVAPLCAPWAIQKSLCRLILGISFCWMELS
jgi:hypothetical protein